MTPEAQWQRTMIGALGLNTPFDSAQLGFPTRRERAVIKPTQAEIDHAVNSISAWRGYLPPTCVAAMIKDGWQWST